MSSEKGGREKSSSPLPGIPTLFTFLLFPDALFSGPFSPSHLPYLDFGLSIVLLSAFFFRASSFFYSLASRIIYFICPPVRPRSPNAFPPYFPLFRRRFSPLPRGRGVCPRADCWYISRPPPDKRTETKRPPTSKGSKGEKREVRAQAHSGQSFLFLLPRTPFLFPFPVMDGRELRRAAPHPRCSDIRAAGGDARRSAQIKKLPPGRTRLAAPGPEGIGEKPGNCRCP